MWFCNRLKYRLTPQTNLSLSVYINVDQLQDQSQTNEIPNQNVLSNRTVVCMLFNFILNL